MPDVPMRYIHFDVSSKESYSLDSVGKHGFGMFLFPQRSTPKSSVLLICVSVFYLQPWRLAPSLMAWWGQISTQQWNRACTTCSTGSVSSTQVQQVTSEMLSLCHTPSFQPLFFPAGTIFEGDCVDVFTMVKHIDYPRDRETGNIIATVHPQLQVRPRYSNKERTPLFVAAQLTIPWCRFAFQKAHWEWEWHAKSRGFDWKWKQTIIYGGRMTHILGK